MYNIHNYFLEERGSIDMTLDGILESIKGTDPVELLPQAHKSISKIAEEPFYVGTAFKQFTRNLNSRFVLVSAPGATGKSAFGKYVAYIRRGLYWNLAEISLGDGSFQGTLYKALGATKISDYAQKLQSGKTTLVIDAFDEAEIISGRKNVETFLTEANEFLEGSTESSIVLLSRTETAQSISTFFKDNKIPHTHYEIDFFPEMNAKEFVIKTAGRRKEVTPAVKQCVDEYFSRIRNIVQDPDVINKFIGYAPVLEAIATHITETNNTARILSELHEGNNEVRLIDRIMDNLLERENIKFTSAFRERLKEDADKITDWDAIYSKKEQLIRLLNYILMGEINVSDYPIDGLPDYIFEEYSETIQLFLPQHPFIQNSFSDMSKSVLDFAGPAFRDYCLAHLMLQGGDSEASAELYYQRESTTARFPSQLFWDHYIDLNEHQIDSKHFVYLMEAYKSKTTVGYATFLDLAQDEEGTHATFRIVSDKAIHDEIDLDVQVSDGQFVFDNLRNTAIDVEGTVIIGASDNAYIIDSSLCCNRLIINSKALSISAYAPCTTTIICTESMEAKVPALNTSVNGDGDVCVDIPNIYDFPRLIKFKKDLTTSEDLDEYLFVHHLRRIFSCFRTHKKDMPARDAEKIEYVIVADNPIKRNIFDFLRENSIIFREAYLYKINLEKMSEFGISWGALISTNIKQLENVYRHFIDWQAQKK